MSQATKELVTAEDLLRRSGEGRSELVEGEVVEMSPVGRRHSKLVVKLARLLAFVEERRLGEVHTEVGFVLSRSPDTVRAPDVAFVSMTRLGTSPGEGFLDGAPDLAIEVLSPDDRASAVMAKVREYLGAGASLVWIVDPATRTVTVHRPSGEAHVHEGSSVVSGENVLPGFELVPAQLFA